MMKHISTWRFITNCRMSPSQELPADPDAKEYKDITGKKGDIMHCSIGVRVGEEAEPA